MFNMSSKFYSKANLGPFKEKLFITSLLYDWTQPKSFSKISQIKIFLFTLPNQIYKNIQPTTKIFFVSIWHKKIRENLDFNLRSSTLALLLEMALLFFDLLDQFSISSRWHIDILHFDQTIVKALWGFLPDHLKNNYFSLILYRIFSWAHFIAPFLNSYSLASFAPRSSCW